MTDDQLNKWMAVNMGGWKYENIQECPSESSTFWVRGEFVVKKHCKTAKYGWREYDEWQDDCPNYTGSGDLMLEVMESLNELAVDLRIDFGAEPELMLAGLTHGIRRPWSGKSADLPRALCELTHEAHENDWLKEPTDGKET